MGDLIWNMFAGIGVAVTFLLAWAYVGDWITPSASDFTRKKFLVMLAEKILR